MTTKIKRGIFRLLPFSMVVILVGSLFLFTIVDNNTIQKAYAASGYSVTQATATVGAATALTIEYTVDTAQQTWADADTLTVILPGNFPTWPSLTFTAQYDDGAATAITAGVGNGQYVVAGDTITIKWDDTTWTTANGGIVRISVTAGAVPQYTNAVSTFTWGGATANGADTDPTGIDNVNVSAADPVASINVTNISQVGTSGTIALTVTTPIAMVATDYIDVTFPANYDVSGANTGGSAVTSDFTGNPTFTASLPGGNKLRLTADGGVPAESGKVLTIPAGIIALYVANASTITTTIYDTSASANTATASDDAIAATTTGAADASIVKTTPVVGDATGTSALTVTIPRELAVGDYFQMTFPAEYTVSNSTATIAAIDITNNSQSATLNVTAPGGNVLVLTVATHPLDDAVGTVITIPANDVIASYVGATDITVFKIKATGGQEIADDTTVALTDTTTGAANASIVKTTPVVGDATGTSALTVTIPRELAVGDYFEMTFPAEYTVANTTATIAAGAITNNSQSATLNVTVPGGNVLRLTVATHPLDDAVGTVITIPANDVIASYVGTTDITVFKIKATGGQEIADDSTVALTDTTAATTLTQDPDASAVHIVGDSTGQVTMTITFPVALVGGDTIKLAFPANYNISTIVTGAGKNYNLDSTVNVSRIGQTLTLTLEGAQAAGAETINFPTDTITPYYTAAGQNLSTLIEKAAGNDVVASAPNTGVNVSIDDTTVGDAATSITLANAAVGAVQNTTLHITVPVNMAATDYIQFVAPNNLDVSAPVYISDSFGGGFVCANTGGQTIRCTASGAETKGVGTIVMSGITGLYAATLQTVTSVVVYDNIHGTNAATSTGGTVTDTTAATTLTQDPDASAVHIVGDSTGQVTMTITFPVALVGGDTIKLAFPANYNISTIVTGAGKNYNLDSTVNVSRIGQTLTLTLEGAQAAGAETINFPTDTITPYYTAAGQNLSTLIEKAAGNDVVASAPNTGVNVSIDDTIVADADASLVLGANATVGTVGNSPLFFDLPVAIGNGDTVVFVAPANLNVAGVTYFSQSFGGGGGFACVPVGQTVTCTANGAVNAGVGGNINMSGILANYEAAGQTISGVVIDDTGNGNVATDGSGTVTDTVAAALAATNVEPATLVAGATGTATVSFTTASLVAIPADGKIKVTFGANFDLTGVLVGDGACSTMDGTFATTRAGQVITITRQNDGTPEVAGAQTCTIAHVKNPGFAGSTGTYTITTTTSGDAIIESDGAVAADTITAGVLAATNVEPASLIASTTNVATVTFTTINSLPANGKIKVTFGAGFNVAAASGGTCTSMDGTFVTTVAGQIVTITRQNDGTPEVAGAQTCSINVVINAGTAGSTGFYGIATTNSTNGVLDEDAAVTPDTIVSAAVACNDGIDNDGDGYIDYPNDRGCTTSTGTTEVEEVTGGGGGGGGAPTSTTSNLTTSTTASTISTITGDQTYSRPVKIEASAITVNSENQTTTAQVTDNGTLTLKPNAQSTISLSVPPNTSVEGNTSWDGRIDPPLVKSLNVIDTKGEEINGSTDTLARSEVAVVVKAGSDKTTLTFSNDITIKIPVDLPDGTSVKLYSSKEGNVWDYLGTGVVENGFIVVKTDHLTYFAAAPGAGPIAAAKVATEAVFGDITGHWAETYINTIFDLGIVSGKTPTAFAPDDSITRAELTKMAVKAFGLARTTVTTSSFMDVAPDAWYASYIEAAAKAGWVEGFDALEGTAKAFSPDANVNRAEALKILISAAGFADVDSNFAANYTSHADYWYVAFPDVLIGDWFGKYVAYAKVHDIVGGYADGNFMPGNYITRAEAAKIITKILDMK